MTGPFATALVAELVVVLAIILGAIAIVKHPQIIIAIVGA